MRFAQPVGKKLSQGAEVLAIKSLHRRDVNEKYAHNKIFRKGLKVLIRHDMREFWVNNKEASLHDTAILATYLLRLQEQNFSLKKTKPFATRLRIQRENPRLSHKLFENAAQCKFSFSRLAFTKRAWRTWNLAVDKMKHSTSRDSLSMLNDSLKVWQALEDAAYCEVCLSKIHETFSQWHFILVKKRHVFTSFCNCIFKWLSKTYQAP